MFVGAAVMLYLLSSSLCRGFIFMAFISGSRSLRETPPPSAPPTDVAGRMHSPFSLPYSPLLFFFLKILVFASTLVRRVGGRRRGSEGVTGWGARAVPSEKE